MMKLMVAAVGMTAMILAGCSSSDSHREPHPKTEKARMAKEIDPVCGMEVNTAGAPSEKFHGQTWYFCSEPCETQFRSAPAAYVTPVHREAEVK